MENISFSNFNANSDDSEHDVFEKLRLLFRDSVCKVSLKNRILTRLYGQCFHASTKTCPYYRTIPILETNHQSSSSVGRATSLCILFELRRNGDQLSVLRLIASLKIVHFQSKQYHKRTIARSTGKRLCDKVSRANQPGAQHKATHKKLFKKNIASTPIARPLQNHYV